MSQFDPDMAVYKIKFSRLVRYYTLTKYDVKMQQSKTVVFKVILVF